jgi:hypothetical protein
MHYVNLWLNLLPKKNLRTGCFKAPIYFVIYTIGSCKGNRYWNDKFLTFFYYSSANHSLMGLSPSWEAANFAYSKKFPILWHPKIHFRVHKSPPLLPILRQIHPIHPIPSYHSKIHFSIVQPRKSWFSQLSLSFRISHQYPICIPFLSHSYYKPCQSYPSWLDYSNYTWRRVQVMKLLII